jgi:xanthine dehydrogenase YagR molybdenum-binding subunit
MDVVFVHEDDPHGSPLHAKGIGELGICGAAAAVINAIHNATGARIREFPATPDKLLATLESLDA